MKILLEEGQLLHVAVKLDRIEIRAQETQAAARTATAPVASGGALVVEDRAKKRELWNSAVEAWFPEGPDDDRVVLLKVDGDSAEYWDSPGGRLATVFSFAKAKVTGQRIDAGENEKVDL